MGLLEFSFQFLEGFRQGTCGINEENLAITRIMVTATGDNCGNQSNGHHERNTRQDLRGSMATRSRRKDRTSKHRLISSKLFLGQEDRLRWYFNGPDLFQGTAVESNLT